MDRGQTYRRAVISGTGPVQTWTDLSDVEQDLVSFQTTFVFECDGTVLTSHSTLRFRTRAELAGSLTAAGLVGSVRHAAATVCGHGLRPRPNSDTRVAFTCRAGYIFATEVA
jgi:hypothetical protein